MSALILDDDYTPNDLEFDALYNTVWNGYAPRASPMIETEAPAINRAYNAHYAQRDC